MGRIINQTFIFCCSLQKILQQSWNGLASVTKRMDANEQMTHVSDVRQAVRFALSDLRQEQEGGTKEL